MVNFDYKHYCKFKVIFNGDLRTHVVCLTSPHIQPYNNSNRLACNPLIVVLLQQVRTKYPDIPVSKKKYQTISTLIGYLINDVVCSSEKNIEHNGVKTIEDVKTVNKILVSYSDEVDEKTTEIKEYLQKNVYKHYKVERMRVKAERCVTLLFQTYRENPSLLPQKYLQRMESELKERVICDYIAGMTDRYALDEYKKLFEPYERV